jgi:hypothetical protein
METPPKRSYIHRKRYLNDSVHQIKAVLDFIRLVRREPASPEDSHRQALAHAQSIEAVCWRPHSRLPADVYQRMMSAKTQEVCRTILRTSLPSFDFSQLQGMLGRTKNTAPQLPLPILNELSWSDRVEPRGIEFPALENITPDIAPYDIDSGPISVFGEETEDYVGQRKGFYP